MRHTFKEMVLVYRAEQLEAWKAGDKSLMPGEIEHRAIVDNQPAYHFGEAFVLDHFMRLGWLGFADYVLMPQVEPNIARHREGRQALERIADPRRLAALRRERNRSVDGMKGYGEPDLFLYQPTGEIMFVEVKKAGDTIKENQLVCLAQLKEFLSCDAVIVYLQASGKPDHKAKQFTVDLETERPPIIDVVVA